MCSFVAGTAFGASLPGFDQNSAAVNSSSTMLSFRDYRQSFMNLIDQGEARFRVWARIWREVPQARPIKRVVTPTGICTVIKPGDCQSGG